jgi:hypothetical protein
MSEIGPTTVLLATGAREHPDTVRVTSMIAKYVLCEAPGLVIVRHGACPGPRSVDRAVHEWIRDCGESLGVTEDAMPADWDHCGPECPPYGILPHRVVKKLGDIFHPGQLDTYCPAAGPRRNRQMVDKQPRADLTISAPYGKSYGTRNCTDLAQSAGIPVRPVLLPGMTPNSAQEAMF